MADSSSNSGLGFFSILTLIFIVLKLTEVIAWSWWLVLSPMLLGFALWCFVVVCFVLVKVLG